MLFSEPKISQSASRPSRERLRGRFSALQRAENFSIAARLGLTPYYEDVSVLFSEPKISQSGRPALRLYVDEGFSALQRAENFSIKPQVHCDTGQCAVSVLFSEPKISQSVQLRRIRQHGRVSVLFSEPKISQLTGPWRNAVNEHCFSALQRAENFSILRRWRL